MSVNFDATFEDVELIEAIAERAAKALPPIDKETAAMDVTACHLNGTPLDLEKLLHSSDFSFAHDIIGINQHISHASGRLMHHFLPRSAQPQQPPSN